MQSEQLPTESQVFKDEVLAGAKRLTIHPRRCRSDTIMARIISELSEFSFFAKAFILQVYDVLARHRPRFVTWECC